MSKDYYSTRIGGRPALDIPNIKGICSVCLKAKDNCTCREDDQKVRARKEADHGRVNKEGR